MLKCATTYHYMLKMIFENNLKNLKNRCNILIQKKKNNSKAESKNCDTLHKYVKQSIAYNITNYFLNFYYFQFLWQNLNNMVTLSQKRNCTLQNDLTVNFRIVFRFQYKAGCDVVYLRILQYFNCTIRIFIVKCEYYP